MNDTNNLKEKLKQALNSTARAISDDLSINENKDKILGKTTQELDREKLDQKFSAKKKESLN